MKAGKKKSRTAAKQIKISVILTWVSLEGTTTKTVCKSHSHFTVRGVDDRTPLTVGWLYKESRTAPTNATVRGVGDPTALTNGCYL
jgi:hypothetical protein